MNRREGSTARSTRWRRVVMVLLVVCTTGCDVATKEWARTALSDARTDAPAVCTRPPPAGMQRASRAPVQLVRGWLELAYAENCGGAWSVMRDTPQAVRTPFFLLVGLAAVGVLLAMARRYEAQPLRLPTLVGPALVLAGTLGNVSDRLRRGYVVDFVHAHARARMDYPVFNVADAALVVGIALLLVASLRARPVA